MPLRKSPRRTRALLAANRRNSRKSTGPRTAAGKRQSAWNAVRHGRRARASCRCIPLTSRDLKAFTEFYFKLHDAIIPAENLVGEQTVLGKALGAWKVKRLLDRWIETRTEEDWLTLAAGAAPPPSFWRLRLRRPGISVPDWTITLSVWLRWSRGPERSRASTPPEQDNDNVKPCRPRMHTMVSVRSTGPSRPGEALEGVPRDPEWVRTKPESCSSQSSSENIPVAGTWDPDFAAGHALADGLIQWVKGWGKRTKPESYRNQEACRNMSPAGARPWRNPSGTSEVRTVTKIFGAIRTALISRKEPSQLELFQTNPECLRKEVACKNMSTALGWMAAAVPFLLKPGSNRVSGPAAPGRV